MGSDGSERECKSWKYINVFHLRPTNHIPLLIFSLCSPSKTTATASSHLLFLNSMMIEWVGDLSPWCSEDSNGSYAASNLQFLWLPVSSSSTRFRLGSRSFVWFSMKSYHRPASSDCLFPKKTCPCHWNIMTKVDSCFEWTQYYG